MTTQLEKVFHKISKLPDIEQNIVAKWIEEEIEIEKKWEKLFAKSENVLNKLSDDAIKEYKNWYFTKYGIILLVIINNNLNYFRKSIRGKIW